MKGNCSQCGASHEKQHTHEGFGGKINLMCKVCGFERAEKS